MKQHEKVAAVYCRTAQPDDFAILGQKDRLARLANAKGYDTCLWPEALKNGESFSKTVLSCMFSSLCLSS